MQNLVFLIYCDHAIVALPVVHPLFGKHSYFLLPQPWQLYLWVCYKKILLGCLCCGCTALTDETHKDLELCLGPHCDQVASLIRASLLGIAIVVLVTVAVPFVVALQVQSVNFELVTFRFVTSQRRDLQYISSWKFVFIFFLFVACELWCLVINLQCSLRWLLRRLWARHSRNYSQIVLQNILKGIPIMIQFWSRT